MEFLPDRTQVTSGWSYSHLNARAAGVRPWGSFWNSALAVWGSMFTSRPPRRGSMITTGRPLAWAYRRPSTPAWEVSSM